MEFLILTVKNPQKELLHAVADGTPHPASPDAVPGVRVEASKSDLPAAAEKVLKAMAGGGERTAKDVAHEVGLPEPRVQYFLDVLNKRQFVEDLMYVGTSTFVLTAEGRNYLFDHGMLE